MSEIDVWLTSIVEDDPIPFEIKNIIFFYLENGKTYSLGLGGKELTPSIVDDFEYYPLESQFCFEKELLKITNEDYFKSLAKSMIDECFFDKNLKQQFSNRKVYFGKFGEKPEYLFTIVE